jgi:hypothetical protein
MVLILLFLKPVSHRGTKARRNQIHLLKLSVFFSYQFCLAYEKRCAPESIPAASMNAILISGPHDYAIQQGFDVSFGFALNIIVLAVWVVFSQKQYIISCPIFTFTFWHCELRY